MVKNDRFIVFSDNRLMVVNRTSPIGRDEGRFENAANERRGANSAVPRGRRSARQNGDDGDYDKEFNQSKCF